MSDRSPARDYATAPTLPAMSYKERKALREDIAKILDGPAPLKTLTDLYHAPTGQVLRQPTTGLIWLQVIPNGWQRTGLAGLYRAERVAQDLPLQPLQERPAR